MIRLNIFFKTLFHCLFALALLFGNSLFSQSNITDDGISSLILDDTIFVEQHEQYIINKAVNDCKGAFYSENSVLSSGKWYKVALDRTGVYKITYSDMMEWGIPVASINARNIRVYHNGGGLVPVINSEPRHDDLVEIPIHVSSNGETFGENDYILFYARGPVVWQYNSLDGFYEHVKNPYSDKSFAFINFDLGEGKRLQYADTPAGAKIPTSTFLDAKLVEEDQYNINNMGKTWYFDLFDLVLSRDYDFSFPNIITSKPSKLRAEFASRNFSNSNFSVKYNGNLIDKQNFNSINDKYTYAIHKSTGVKSFNASNSNISLELTYSRSMSSSSGWLDYIVVNAWRNLVFTGSMMPFRNPECSDTSSVYEYALSNAAGVQVWNVTNPVEPLRVRADMQSSVLKFSVNGDINNEFVAFNGTSFNVPEYVGVVQNQNLHAKRDIDYLIIAHPDFYQQAQRLKDLHALVDDLVIDIVTPSDIYNEFSCGAVDIAGIRDYIKMLHDVSSEGHKLKYVLLFGDASYDYRNKSGNVCFVPTYESVASCDIRFSNVTDDFFVCLDDNEGNMENKSSISDLAIGRIPVSTSSQATKMIDKIESYMFDVTETMSNWRNVMTLVCDDDQENDFLSLSELIQDTLVGLGADFIFDKIYLDAYNQIATSNGQRSPETNEAITNRIERGTLIVNYIGHGGEVGLADERIFKLEDINGLQNFKMLPLFVTATCEFSRFDDHTRTSAGEYLYLNEHGGAINMVTTARVAQAPASQLLLYRFYRKLFTREPDGQLPRLGDAFLAAKQNDSGNTKIFAFFGDPALRLAYPKNKVELLSVNGNTVDDGLDTLKALSSVNMVGAVKDHFGNVLDDFNGMAYISVYDKENDVVTHGDEESTPISFKINNSLIYNGKTEVVNGVFSIDFIVPKDINYSYGKGVVSLYATDYNEDAIGLFSGIVVGGYDDTVIPDAIGPEVRIFIDDTLFVNGMKTNESPVFYAYVKDPNGINTTGAGIGHDITVQLTGATNKTYNLNQYYEYPLDIDAYGNVVYKFYNLNEGEHHLRFRVWDIYNNSTTKELTFNVVKSSYISLDNLMNYPNPMRTDTRFIFEHNQKDAEIEVVIRIYDINGQLVRTIQESRFGSTMRIEPVYWDGCSDNGVALPSGIYIYNVTVINEQNESMIGHSKLIISR